MPVTKPLYVLISDGGDGSYYPHYTLNKAVIDKLQAKYDSEGWDEGFLGADGDGFHYDIIQVPADSTPESLGISVLDDDEDDEDGEA